MAKAESISRPAFVEVHIDRLVKNLRYLQSKTRHPFFCPMLKADAYGHGDTHVANVLQGLGVSRIGVATLDEAIRIRKGGFQHEILVFSGSFQACVAELSQYKLTPVLSSPAHLQDFKSSKASFNVHIKLNTGMNRMGFDEKDIEEVLLFCKNKGFTINGVLTHLHCGRDIDSVSGESHSQIQRFETLRQKYFSTIEYSHVYNSEGLLHAKDLTYGARPGIALYGYAEDDDVNLHPVMEVKARLVSLRSVKANQFISYGASYKTAKDSLIGVLPLGYADGLFRSSSNKNYFLLDGVAVPQVGTICMDYAMVDLTEMKQQAKVGSLITIIGNKSGHTAKDMANHAGTISYEVLTSISERMPRVYVE